MLEGLGQPSQQKCQFPPSNTPWTLSIHPPSTPPPSPPLSCKFQHSRRSKIKVHYSLEHPPLFLQISMLSQVWCISCTDTVCELVLVKCKLTGPGHRGGLGQEKDISGSKGPLAKMQRYIIWVREGPLTMIYLCHRGLLQRYILVKGAFCKNI